MSNKLKAILIAAEVLVLVGLLVLGASCQSRFNITGGSDGPRFDWYGSDEDDNEPIYEGSGLGKPTDPTEEEPSTEPEPSAEPYSPPAPPMAPDETEETTEPTESTTEPTEATTEPEEITKPTDPPEPTPPPATDSSGNREDEFPLTPVG